MFSRTQARGHDEGQVGVCDVLGGAAGGLTVVKRSGNAVVMSSCVRIHARAGTAASLCYGGPPRDLYRSPREHWLVNNLLRNANRDALCAFGLPSARLDRQSSP